MKILDFKTNDFRNLRNIDVEFSDNINLIYGNNGQGKTNLIEAIWLFSGFKSFRNAKDTEMANFVSKTYDIEINFKDSDSTNNLKIQFSNKKQIYYNEIKQKGTKELLSKLYIVSFSPSDIYFFKSGPKERRKYLDICISKVKPLYLKYILEYEKLIYQRNCLIRNTISKSKIYDTLDMWDLQISKVGTLISVYRFDYIKKILPLCKDIYIGISNKREDFEIKFASSVFKEPIFEYNQNNVKIFYDKLKSEVESDIKYGRTRFGIHRDDVYIFLNNIDVGVFGSQGQKRSCIISLKLAEADIIKDIVNESPIILLDDVMSELDFERQDYILNCLKDFQVFITCCDLINAERLKKGKVFNIECGKLIDSFNV